jgi:hypothetical protein
MSQAAANRPPLMLIKETERRVNFVLPRIGGRDNNCGPGEQKDVTK